jgi:hypothetical protein
MTVKSTFFVLEKTPKKNSCPKLNKNSKRGLEFFLDTLIINLRNLATCLVDLVKLLSMCLQHFASAPKVTPIYVCLSAGYILILSTENHKSVGIFLPLKYIIESSIGLTSYASISILYTNTWWQNFLQGGRIVSFFIYDFVNHTRGLFS